MKKHKAYLLKNYDVPIAVEWRRRDCVAIAKENLKGTIHEKKWQTIYQIVKCEVLEIEGK